MIFLVGTTSQLKINALYDVLTSYLTSREAKIIEKEVPSGVSPTPSGGETYLGATNRARGLYKRYQAEGDYFVGIESGLAEREGNLFEEVWCVILNNKGRESVGYSSGFILPKSILERLKKGETHQKIMSTIQKDLELKHKDTWAIYSSHRLSRLEGLKEAFRNALLAINL